MKKSIRKITPLLIVMLLCLSVVAAFGLTGCSSGDRLATPKKFSFDETTGEYSFNGVDGASYYYVTLYGYDSDTDVPDTEPTFKSDKISEDGSGTYSGRFDGYSYDALKYSAFRASVTAYVSFTSDMKDSGPATKTFVHSGQLSAPHISYTQDDGGNVTFSFDNVAEMKDEEHLPEKIEIYIYDEAGSNLLQTATIEGYYETQTQMGSNWNDTTVSVRLSSGRYTVRAKAFGVKEKAGQICSDSEVSGLFYTYAQFEKETVTSMPWGNITSMETFNYLPDDLVMFTVGDGSTGGNYATGYEEEAKAILQA